MEIYYMMPWFSPTSSIRVTPIDAELEIELGLTHEVMAQLKKERDEACVVERRTTNELEGMLSLE